MNSEIKVRTSSWKAVFDNTKCPFGLNPISLAKRNRCIDSLWRRGEEVCVN